MTFVRAAILLVLSITLSLSASCDATEPNTAVTIVNDSGAQIFVQQCQKPLFGSPCENTGDRRTLAADATMTAGVPGQNRIAQWWQVLDGKRKVVGCLKLQNDLSGNELVFPVSAMEPCPD